MKVVQVYFPNHAVEGETSFICLTPEDAAHAIGAEIQAYWNGDESKPLSMEVSFMEMSEEDFESLRDC